jgi:hypothetical protein
MSNGIVKNLTIFVGYHTDKPEKAAANGSLEGLGRVQ